MSDVNLLQELFGTLRKAVLANKLDKVISTADEILAVEPTAVDALKCKVVALARKSKFDEAIAAAGVEPTLAAERSYCA
jgi:signal recognition particle subunit SRP72